MANKVKFGLKNVHYALLTETESSGSISYSWATPVHVAGAVSLNLDAESSNNIFYADNINYFSQYANNGYSGDLEMALVPDSMLTALFGDELDSTNKILYEGAATKPKDFALLFQIDGDEKNRGYVLYKCSAGRPSLEGSTIEDTKEPNTQTMSITASALDDTRGTISAHTTDDASAAQLTAWFTSVQYQATITT